MFIYFSYFARALCRMALLFSMFVCFAKIVANTRHTHAQTHELSLAGTGVAFTNYSKICTPTNLSRSSRFERTRSAYIYFCFFHQHSQTGVFVSLPYIIQLPRYKVVYINLAYICTRVLNAQQRRSQSI